jgi:hypothetical protein
MFATLRRWRPWAVGLLALALLAPAGCKTSPTTGTPTSRPAPAPDKDKAGPKPPNPDVG